MKDELIEQAKNIPNFDKQADELNWALGMQGYVGSHEKQIHIGFKLALNLIEQCPELIKPTLYETMKEINKTYKQLTKFKYDHGQINAVSLAVNLLRNLNLAIKIHKYNQAYAEPQKFDDKISGHLAYDKKNWTKKIEPPRKRKRKHESIWALKVEGIDSETAKPFVIGNRIFEVAEKLGVSTAPVSNAINNKYKIVNGYKLWTE
jgi:hypothetical protein